MTPTPNGLSLGDYRDRLIHYKDAETEKNEMINVSWDKTLARLCFAYPMR